MRIFYFYLLVFLPAITINSSKAQQNTPVHIGTVKGIVRDTARNYVLKSATVSIYKAKDSSLLSYQISNNYGEFSFKNLPVNTGLRIDISHVGYQLLRKIFSIPGSKNAIDLQTLIISPSDITLKDVVISIPPISMNGDTLEFNAAAFKLDSNAVVEDLLRKIPNVTLWGDGQITVNGREVKSLLVNGKPFFGNNPKIALQNIAKNALEKIQVYHTQKDKSNPLDSTLEVNLKLKKGKDIGYFGKIGIGYGTNHRYEGDASFNLFSPKMQLAVIAASNNVNKIPNDAETLTSNSTFKGINTNVEYQPDFRTTGLTQPTTVGVTFQYNFVEKPTWNNKNALSSNYFLQHKDNENLSDKITVTSINNTDKIFEKSSNKGTAVSTNQKFDSGYEWLKDNKSLRISQSMTINDGDTKSETRRTAENTKNELTSTNNSLNQNNYKNRKFNLDATYQVARNYMKPMQLFKGLKATYAVQVHDDQNQSLNITAFKSYTDAASDQKFNRKYDTRSKGINQQIDLEFMDLKSMFFGRKQLAGIDFSLTNNLNLRTTDQQDQVQDLEPNNSHYENNTYLTNNVNTTIIEETPGLNFKKTFSRNLSNRYSKNLTIRFLPKQKFLHQNNESEKSFQNIKRSYTKFLPDAAIDYNDHQFGEYYRNYTLSFSTKIQMPTLQQMAPLADSTNLYSLQKGNLNLKAATEKVIAFTFNHSDQGTKNTLNYNTRISAGMINDRIVDSIYIDHQNRRSIYLTNANGHKYLNFYANVRKAYKFKTSEIQFGLSTNIDANKSPGYTNNVFTFSKNLNTGSRLSVNYTYQGHFALAVAHNYNTYSSKQEAFNTGYSGTNQATSISSSYNVTRRFTLNSNVSFNTSTSKDTEDINFTIWNAGAVYRFLKGNNAEFKLSALDLLHQNTSVINYANANSFTTGTQKVLQQYFMVTISYYPRQFGKKTAKK
ncbi:hypothetical protein SAMN05421820_107275 [Pedobacter steynii]|uniref:Outer membrane protein beta-barrel domain-containing protein n=1 Tax=Pedobacter steynii TaxID=430522 RepID=A0A1H0B196_9SPHI|nr:TonB-dependent receptor [Pedobacter steynii]NQX41190.1 hypothetical protein [Pedobacter steynii]SDN39430.1 hypothetical protein SAMN05421820_107275 [Pedobacter steynii]